VTELALRPRERPFGSDKNPFSREIAWAARAFKASSRCHSQVSDGYPAARPPSLQQYRITKSPWTKHAGATAFQLKSSPAGWLPSQSTALPVCAQPAYRDNSVLRGAEITVPREVPEAPPSNTGFLRRRLQQAEYMNEKAPPGEGGARVEASNKPTDRNAPGSRPTASNSASAPPPP
jgi:hypothetical protein